MKKLAPHAFSRMNPAQENQPFAVKKRQTDSFLFAVFFSSSGLRQRKLFIKHLT